MIPLDIILMPKPITALKAWRDDNARWTAAGAPWPGLQAAYRAWRDGAPLREIAGDDIPTEEDW